MKVLVATRAGQGDRPGDFSHTKDQELVYLGEVCDADRFNPDAGCGCGRAFIGLTTAAGTTTAEVREVDLTREQFTTAIREARGDAGWGTSREPIEVIVGQVLDAIAGLPVGTIVGRRLDQVIPRS